MQDGIPSRGIAPSSCQKIIAVISLSNTAFSERGSLILEAPSHNKDIALVQLSTKQRILSQTCSGLTPSQTSRQIPGH